MKFVVKVCRRSYSYAFQILSGVGRRRKDDWHMCTYYKVYIIYLVKYVCRYTGAGNLYLHSVSSNQIHF